MMNQLRSAALWTILLSLVLKLSGFIREAIISKQFGASIETDAFSLSFGFITLTIALISSGFNNVFLPLYIDARRQQSPHATQNASAILNWSIVLFIVMSVLGYYFADVIVPLLFGTMIGDTKQLTIELTQLFFAMLTLVSLSAILDSYLQAQRIFVPSQVAKLSATLFAALFALFFSETIGIFSVVLGFGVGTLFGVLVQLFYLSRSSFEWTFTFGLEKTFKRQFLLLLLPALLHSAVGQINLFIDRSFASNTTTAAVTYLNNASLLASIPHAILMTTIIVLIFTLLNEQAHDRAAFAETVQYGLFILTIVLLPIVVGLYAVGDVALAFIYERGKFTPTDTAKTYEVLVLYLPFVLFQGYQMLLSKTAFALKRTNTMFAISAFSIIINFVLNFILVERFSYPALAISTSIVTFYLFVATGTVVFQAIGVQYVRSFIWMFVRTIPAAAGMGIVLLYVQSWTFFQHGHPFIVLVILVLFGIIVYSVALYLTYRSGFRTMMRLIRKNKSGNDG